MLDNPLSFTSIIGQEKAKRLWQRTFFSKRLAHAYLFRGPDGVGKRMFARLAAAQINCAHPNDDGGCGQCGSCRKYLSGNHPDLSFVSPEGAAIKIDRVREVCRSLSFAPYESAVRVVIFEDVHTLRSEAANSLLKTLEEPPEHNILILTAESSRPVLPTILSRCQIIPFASLSDEQTAAVLSRCLADAGDAELSLLARAAFGSPGLAMVLQKEGIIGIWRDVVATLKDADGETGPGVLASLAAAEQAASLKQHLPLLFDMMRREVRDEMESIGQRGGDLRRTELLAFRLAAVDRAERRLARNCNRALVCEVLLFDLQSPVPGVS